MRSNEAYDFNKNFSRKQWADDDVGLAVVHLLESLIQIAFWSHSRLMHG